MWPPKRVRLGVIINCLLLKTAPPPNVCVEGFTGEQLASLKGCISTMAVSMQTTTFVKHTPHLHMSLSLHSHTSCLLSHCLRLENKLKKTMKNPADAESGR